MTRGSQPRSQHLTGPPAAGTPAIWAATMPETTRRGPLAFADLTDPGRRQRVQTKYTESRSCGIAEPTGKTPTG